MTTGVYYADTSALVRAYVSGEPHNAELRRRLLNGDVPVVTSVLTRVEFASAVAAAGRAGRLRRPRLLLDRFDADCRENGPVTLLDLDAGTAFPLARRLVREHPLRALDAIHLAVALTEAVELAAGEPVSLVTCDKAQATAADSLGLALACPQGSSSRHAAAHAGRGRPGSKGPDMPSAATASPRLTCRSDP